MSRKRSRMEQMNHQQPIVASSSHHQPFAVPGMSGSLRQWENNRTGQQEEEQSEELSEEEEEFHDVYAGKVYGEHGEGGEEEEEAVEEEEEEEEESEEADFSSLEDDEDLEGSDIVSWISYWCSITGHEYFTEVPEAFIEDQFNLTGLNGQVPFYNAALSVILDGDYEDEYRRQGPDIQIIENSAEMLYGLIHQRWIISRAGLQAMADKYEHASFGHCPRVFCHSTAVVPMGRSDCPAIDTVKLFCPSCLDIYTPPQTRFHAIDGAYFGTTFPHLFFQTFPELLPSPGPQPRLGMRLYIPKIYGFRIHERAVNGPQMQWLRMIPSEEARQTKRGVKRYFELQGIPIELPDDENEEQHDDDDDDDEGESGEEEEDDDMGEQHRFMDDDEYQQMFPDNY